MSTPNPTPSPLQNEITTVVSKVKIEAKVIASTAATFVVSAVIATLNDVENNHALLGSVPSALQTVIIALVPTAITFVSGYFAKHTPR